MENNRNKEIHSVGLGEIIVKESGFPVIPVVDVDDNDNPIGWLSPFRGYRFQVSGTEDGIGDYGDSEVSNAIMRNLKNPETGKGVFEDCPIVRKNAMVGLIYQALYRFLGVWNNSMYESETVAYVPSNTFSDTKKIYEFMNKSIEWCDSVDWRH